MELKPPPKLVLSKVDDGLHHTLDNVASAIAERPKQAIPPVPPVTAQVEKQAVMTYFADLMASFFDALEEWQNLPLEVARQAYHEYMKGLVPELPAKLQNRFIERAEIYTQALFSAMAETEKAASEQNQKQVFEGLLSRLEQAVLEAVELPDHLEEEVIAMAFADYHQALVAGVEAGFLDKETAEFMAEDLQKQLFIAAVSEAVNASDSPVLLALQIADGKTGDPELDALPPQTRMQFLQKLFKEEVNHAPIDA